jgi:hypothetical protein
MWMKENYMKLAKEKEGMQFSFGECGRSEVSILLVMKRGVCLDFDSN